MIVCMGVGLPVIEGDIRLVVVGVKVGVGGDAGLMVVGAEVGVGGDVAEVGVGGDVGLMVVGVEVVGLCVLLRPFNPFVLDPFVLDPFDLPALLPFFRYLLSHMF